MMWFGIKRQKITSFKLCKSPSGFKSEGCLMFIHLFRRKKTGRHIVYVNLMQTPGLIAQVIFDISSLLVNQTACMAGRWKKITFPSRCPIHFNQYTFYWMWPKSSQRSCVHVSESISYTWRLDVHILSVCYKHCITLRYTVSAMSYLTHTPIF